LLTDVNSLSDSYSQANDSSIVCDAQALLLCHIALNILLSKKNPMNILLLEATQDTPRIMLNKRDGIFQLTGRSILEDPGAFYDGVMEWLNDYAQQPNPSTVFTFKLNYFNSASSKVIYDMLHVLKHIQGMQVEWCYHKDDDDILEAGKEFEEEVEMTFNYKQV